MNTLNTPPIINTLNFVSDNLYQGHSEMFLDYDNLCQSDPNTSDYKQVDTLVIYNNIIHLIEFKRCDLFYQDIDAFGENHKKDALKKIEDIQRKASDKIQHCLLVSLPYYLKKYKGNNSVKVKTLYVLGEKRLSKAKSAGRDRAKKKSKYYRQLIQVLNKYNNTAYYLKGEIYDKNEFLNSDVYINRNISWTYP